MGSSSSQSHYDDRHERPIADTPASSKTQSDDIGVEGGQSQASIPPALRSILGYGSPMPAVQRPTGDKRLPKLEIDSVLDNAESNTGENKPKETPSAPAQQEILVHPLNRPASEQPSTLQKSLPPTDDMSPRIKAEPQTTPTPTSHDHHVAKANIEPPRCAVPARAAKSVPAFTDPSLECQAHPSIFSLPSGSAQASPDASSSVTAEMRKKFTWRSRAIKDRRVMARRRRRSEQGCVEVREEELSPEKEYFKQGQRSPLLGCQPESEPMSVPLLNIRMTRVARKYRPIHPP